MDFIDDMQALVIDWCRQPMMTRFPYMASLGDNELIWHKSFAHIFQAGFTGTGAITIVTSGPFY